MPQVVGTIVFTQKAHIQKVEKIRYGKERKRQRTSECENEGKAEHGRGRPSEGETEQVRDTTTD